MIPKRLRNNCRFFLRVRFRGAFLKQAGTRDAGDGETYLAAETTRRISEAQGFQTRRQAERMRDMLSERYGIRSEIFVYDGGGRYEI